MRFSSLVSLALFAPFALAQTYIVGCRYRTPTGFVASGSAITALVTVGGVQGPVVVLVAPDEEERPRLQLGALGQLPGGLGLRIVAQAPAGEVDGRIPPVVQLHPVVVIAGLVDVGGVVLGQQLVDHHVGAGDEGRRRLRLGVRGLVRGGGGRGGRAR